MKIEDTDFDGLKLVRFFCLPDERGIFIKPWVQNILPDVFGEVGEAYISSSNKGVLRGLHFQRGDAAQTKYVVCLSGEIEDIALDLRSGSKTYGKTFRVRLAGMSDTGVVIPAGFAHGIFAHQDSTIINFCNRPYAPSEEGGVNWRSLPGLSDLKVSIVSQKDEMLPPWEAIS
jgi:dTDP-4-dehydrorhamnose 3,5-epimerase